MLLSVHFGILNIFWSKNYFKTSTKTYQLIYIDLIYSPQNNSLWTYIGYIIYYLHKLLTESKFECQIILFF